MTVNTIWLCSCLWVCLCLCCYNLFSCIVFLLQARKVLKEICDKRGTRITERKGGGAFKTVVSADRDGGKEKGGVNE